MAGKFTCDCAGTDYSGANCEVSLLAAPLGTAAAILVLVLAAIAALGYKKYQEKHAAFNFEDILQQFIDDGLINASQVNTLASKGSTVAAAAGQHTAETNVDKPTNAAAAGQFTTHDNSAV